MLEQYGTGMKRCRQLCFVPQLEAKRYDDRHLRCRCEYVESDMALCETASSKHGDTSRPSDAKKQNAIHE